MPNPIKTAASKVSSSVQDYMTTRRVAQENFRNRKDNTNYYKGVEYWKDNTN